MDQCVAGGLTLLQSLLLIKNIMPITLFSLYDEKSHAVALTHCLVAQESQGPTQGSQPSSASREESQKVLAELRAINPLLTKEQEQAAMERLLNRGTQSVRHCRLSDFCFRELL